MGADWSRKERTGTAVAGQGRTNGVWDKKWDNRSFGGTFAPPVISGKCCVSCVLGVEAPSGFEPEMEVLQTSALPLGYGAEAPP
jgi:hypothetical protein